MRAEGLALLSALAAISQFSCGLQSRDARRPIVLASFNVPVDPDSAGNERSKLLVVHGVRLKGEVTATWVNRALLLDGIRWWPPPEQPRIPARAFTDPEPWTTLSPTVERMGRSIPFIRGKVADGIPLLDATNLWHRAMYAMLNDVWQTYRTNLRKLGPARAKALAIARIDTSLAVADTSSKLAPKFFSSGGVTIYFHGFAYMGTPIGSRDGVLCKIVRALSPGPSVGAARSKVRRLAQSLTDPRCVVVIIGRNGEAEFSGGEDATRALAELNETFRTGRAPESDGFIPSALLKEILEVASSGGPKAGPDSTHQGR